MTVEYKKAFFPNLSNNVPFEIPTGTPEQPFKTPNYI